MAEDCFDGGDGIDGDITARITSHFYKTDGFVGGKITKEKKNIILLSGFPGFSVLWVGVA